MRGHLLFCLIATTLLCAPTPAHAQVDQPMFGVMLDPPPGKTKTPGHRGKYRRRYIDMWMALHPNGVKDKREAISMNPKEKEQGGIGKVGGIDDNAKNTPGNTDTQSPATHTAPSGIVGAMAPTPDMLTDLPETTGPQASDEDNDAAPTNAGGIGSVGGVQTSTTDSEDDDNVVSSPAIGKVGGNIGSVGRVKQNAPAPTTAPANNKRNNALGTVGGIGKVGGAGK